MLATLCGILADSFTSSVGSLKKTYNIQCKSSLCVVLEEHIGTIASGWLWCVHAYVPFVRHTPEYLWLVTRLGTFGEPHAWVPLVSHTPGYLW